MNRKEKSSTKHVVENSVENIRPLHVGLDRAIHEYLVTIQCVTAMDRTDYRGCGECCSQFLPLTNVEIVIIRNYIKKHNIDPTYQPIQCPFFDIQNRECRIYEVRPAICRHYDCRKHASGELFNELLNNDSFNSVLKNTTDIDMAKVFCGGHQ